MVLFISKNIIYTLNKIFHGNDFIVLKSPTYNFANKFHVVVNNMSKLYAS